MLLGGKSFGIARHWQPVLRTYMTPFMTSRTFTSRLRPPRLAGGISGSINCHSSSGVDRLDSATGFGRSAYGFQQSTSAAPPITAAFLESQKVQRFKNFVNGTNT